MITITNRSREFSKIEEYLMTISPKIISMKDVVDGASIEVAGYLEFDDSTQEGDKEVTNHILSIITPDNEVYSCQSHTFMRSLKDIEAIMGEDRFAVNKISGKTKAGREYINCVLDVDFLTNK